MYTLINKKDFIKAMDDFRFVHDYHNKLNSFFTENECEGFLYQPDCTKTVLDLLHILFQERDKDDWIEYFVFDLDFGRTSCNDSVIDKNGDSIDISDAGKLYDFLMN